MIHASAHAVSISESAAGAAAASWYASSMLVRATTTVQCRTKSCVGRASTAISRAAAVTLRRAESTGSSRRPSVTSISSCRSCSRVSVARARSEDGGYELIERAQHFGLVGERFRDRRRAGAALRDAAPHELAGVHEETRRCALDDAVAFEVARHVPELNECLRGRGVDAAFARDDARFQLRRGVTELDRDEALPRALLQVLEQAL